MTAVDLARLDAPELWTATRAAAAGVRGGAAGEVARLCTAAGSPRLGWVDPPPWPLVRRAVDAITAALGESDGPTVLLGTGGWSFAARALAEAVGSPRLVAMDSLHPLAIRRALAGAGDIAPRCLVVSGSGHTLETVRLTEVIREVAGGGRARLVWLSDQAGSPDRHALSVCGGAEHIAMLGAPLSTAFLAPAALVDRAALAAGYPRLLDRVDLAVDAVACAVRAPVRGEPLIRLVAPAWASPALRLWLLQLGRQVLCGKSERFRPWVQVCTRDRRTPAPEIRYDLNVAGGGLPGLLEVMYAAGVFVASLAMRAGVPVAEHANVSAYKRLVDSVAPDTALPTVAAPDLAGFAATWLAARPEVRRLHVVRYDGPAPRGGARGFARTTGRDCEVHEGTAWNHHSFQAVYADRATAALLVAAPPSTGGPPAVTRAGRSLRRVALATAAALGERAMVVQVDAGEDPS